MSERGSDSHTEGVIDQHHSDAPLNIGVLSRAPEAYSTKRIVEAIRDRGHQPRVLDTLRFAIDLSERNPELFHRGKRIEEIDAVIPRIGTSITFYGLAVLRQFEQMDVYTPNTSNAVASSRDKLRANQVLARHGIAMPRTTFVQNRNDILPAIERVGGAPIVIKLLEGTQGIGVILAPDVKVAEAVIETLHSTRHNVLVQEFIAESKGRDIRAFVVGDRVVGAMRRVAKPGEFRSNVHRGGHAESIDLPDAFAETAVRSAQIMGLEVAGVDMLEGADGPMVMEVNSSPGLEGIEGATGLDIAGAIVDHVASRIVFPDVDVRQRLSVSANYGVAELTLNDGAAIFDRADTVGDLRELDITVLTLHHDRTVIPHPRDGRPLHPGDRVVCFGNLEVLRTLVPKRKRRERLPEIKPLETDLEPTS